MSDLTNEITNGLITGMNFNTINSIALFLLIIYLVSALFDFLQGIIMATVANKFAQKMRTQISKRLTNFHLDISIHTAMEIYYQELQTMLIQLLCH